MTVTSQTLFGMSERGPYAVNIKLTFFSQNIYFWALASRKLVIADRLPSRLSPCWCTLAASPARIADQRPRLRCLGPRRSMNERYTRVIICLTVSHR